MHPLFGFVLGVPEMIIIGIIGVLLFGRRLPDVGRYLGKGIVEFKKGVRGLEDGIDDVAHPPAANRPGESAPADAIRAPQRVTATAPKFEETNVTAPPRV